MTLKNAHYVNDEGDFRFDSMIRRRILIADCISNKCVVCHNKECGQAGFKPLEKAACESCGELVKLDDINEFGDCPNCCHEEPSEIESWDFER